MSPPVKDSDNKGRNSHDTSKFLTAKKKKKVVKTREEFSQQEKKSHNGGKDFYQEKNSDNGGKNFHDRRKILMMEEKLSQHEKSKKTTVIYNIITSIHI